MSFNNLSDENTITSVPLAGSPVAETLTSNGIAYTDPLRREAAAPIHGQDAVSILPGRSVMVSVTFGFLPRGCSRRRSQLLPDGPGRTGVGAA
jgi:iron complex outermembrane receptor protein